MMYLKAIKKGKNSSSTDTFGEDSTQLIPVDDLQVTNQGRFASISATTPRGNTYHFILGEPAPSEQLPVDVIFIMSETGKTIEKLVAKR